MIPLFKVYMDKSVNSELKKILHSGYISQGKKVEEFEQKLKKIFNYPYILSLNSATSAMTLALRIVNDNFKNSNKNEVISVPLTCMATNLPILNNGMRIKWADVNLENGLIDIDDIEKKLTKNTKAISFVHWGGYPLDLDKLNRVLNRKKKELGFKPAIIEDCAHAMLSELNGKKLGTFKNFAIFSLQAIKHLTTGDGGLLFCPDLKTYKKAKLLRWFGIDRENKNNSKIDSRLENDVKEWGYKFHMNDINATIGINNLKSLEKIIKKNRYNSKYLYNNLKNFKNLKCLNPVSKKFKSSYWLFTIRIKNKNKFMKYMNDQGIFVSQVHKRNDVHTCFKKFRAKLSNLDKLEKEIVCIPCGWWLTKKELNHIIKKIKVYCNTI
tara:strand:+ start:305 stop:1450 length:1146 start_codon:yes stop_codon:yes gene_type:complete